MVISPITIKHNLNIIFISDVKIPYFIQYVSDPHIQDGYVCFFLADWTTPLAVSFRKRVESLETENLEMSAQFTTNWEFDEFQSVWALQNLFLSLYFRWEKFGAWLLSRNEWGADDLFFKSGYVQISGEKYGEKKRRPILVFEFILYFPLVDTRNPDL